MAILIAMGAAFLLTIIGTQFFIISKFDLFMTKAEFLQAMADFKAEITVVSGKVDALEALINNPQKDVDPEIVTAFQDLKTSMDQLNQKADNNPGATTSTGATPTV